MKQIVIKTITSMVAHTNKSNKFARSASRVPRKPKQQLLMLKTGLKPKQPKPCSIRYLPMLASRNTNSNTKISIRSNEY